MLFIGHKPLPSQCRMKDRNHRILKWYVSMQSNALNCLAAYIYIYKIWLLEPVVLILVSFTENREEEGQTNGRYSSTASLPMKSNRGRHRQAYICWIFYLNNMSMNVSVHSITVMKQRDVPVLAESVAERTTTAFILR